MHDRSAWARRLDLIFCPRCLTDPDNAEPGPRGHVFRIVVVRHGQASRVRQRGPCHGILVEAPGHRHHEATSSHGREQRNCARDVGLFAESPDDRIPRHGLRPQRSRKTISLAVPLPVR
jgi:hypothetical protein